MKVLVIAPHPDDELLGVGGTISKRAAAGHDVYVCVVTKGLVTDFDSELIEQGRIEDKKACEILGVKNVIFLNFPASRLEETLSMQINNELSRIIRTIQPNELFIPHSGDIHIDHQIVALSSLVAARPKYGTPYPRRVLSYEVLSETGWNAPGAGTDFSPNVYEDISEHIDNKVKAISMFKTQLYLFPHPRSITAVESLARYRGSTVGVSAAEAFMLIREVRR